MSGELSLILESIRILEYGSSFTGSALIVSHSTLGSHSSWVFVRFHSDQVSAPLQISSKLLSFGSDSLLVTSGNSPNALFSILVGWCSFVVSGLEMFEWFKVSWLFTFDLLMIPCSCCESRPLPSSCMVCSFTYLSFLLLIPSVPSFSNCWSSIRSNPSIFSFIPFV